MIEFFDNIPIVVQNGIVVEPLPNPPLNVALREEYYPPIEIREALYERNNGGHKPFYLNIHICELLLQNCMIDWGVAMNVMPKIIMEAMGLQITRPYNNVC